MCSYSCLVHACDRKDVSGRVPKQTPHGSILVGHRLAPNDMRCERNGVREHAQSGHAAMEPIRAARLKRSVECAQ